jgi:hypothetical protein
MKNLLKKCDHLSPAFFHVGGNFLDLVPGASVSGIPKTTRQVVRPKRLTPGTDYAIIKDKAYLKAVKLTSEPKASAIGGFHVGLDGVIVNASIWDQLFRPRCPDPRGMVFAGKYGWIDIYLLNTDPGKHGTSAAGVEIADGWSNIILPDGKGRALNFWVATHALSLHGKQLLSCEEFTAVMQGVEEGKTCGDDPKKTGHVRGLKSAIGIEQATGCMYVWSRDIKDLDVPWIFLMSGAWTSDAAGPRRFDYNHPGSDYYAVGARGRCDHLFPDRSEAKA